MCIMLNSIDLFDVKVVDRTAEVAEAKDGKRKEGVHKKEHWHPMLSQVIEGGEGTCSVVVDDEDSEWDQHDELIKVAEKMYPPQDMALDVDDEDDEFLSQAVDELEARYFKDQAETVHLAKLGMNNWILKDTLVTTTIMSSCLLNMIRIVVL